MSRPDAVAERMGFEPMARCRVTGFQDRLLKPLGHLSTCACSMTIYYNIFPEFYKY